MITPKVTIPEPYKLLDAVIAKIDPDVMKEFNLAPTAMMLRTHWETPKGDKLAFMVLGDPADLERAGELIWWAHFNEVKRACGEEIL